MTAEQIQEFITWCRSQGAVRVQVDGIAVDFAGKQAPAPQEPRRSPAKVEPDEDERLSPEEREKLRREKYMFWSSQ